MSTPPTPAEDGPVADERRANKRSGRTSPLAAALGAVTPPLDLRILGRTLLHTALVGFGGRARRRGASSPGLEYTQAFLLEHVAGYIPLRAHGEKILGEAGAPRPCARWCIVFLPAVGALLAGLVVACCAGDARRRRRRDDSMPFTTRAASIRRRVIWVKALASILTLGTGGSGGREGPTMQIGGALGSLVGLAAARQRARAADPDVAGVAAGMSAVFRTPLGAALLAVEVLYRDDFESDALDPRGPRQRGRRTRSSSPSSASRRCSRTRRATRSSRRTCRSTRCWPS